MLLRSRIILVTFIIGLVYVVAECQYPPPGSGPDNSPGPPGPGPGDVWSMWAWMASLFGKKGCNTCGCGSGGCSGGGTIININQNNNNPSPGDHSGSTTVDHSGITSVPTTLPSSPSPPCQASINSGPFFPGTCQENFFSAVMLIGSCLPYQVSFELTGLPCGRVQSNGEIVFDASLGCAVGVGVSYYGNLRAWDSFSQMTLGADMVVVDTSSIQYCITTTPTSTPSTDTPTTGSLVCIFSYPNSGYFSPYQCTANIFTPLSLSMGCTCCSRVTFQLTGLPCASVQNDGTVTFDPLSQGCSVGQGTVYYGTVTAVDIFTGMQYSSVQITVDTTNLQNCFTTSSTTTTGLPCTMSVTPASLSFAPTSCSEVILMARTSGCTDSDFYRINWKTPGLPSNCFAFSTSSGLPWILVFTPIQPYNQFYCDVGQGVSYSGNITAYDVYNPGVNLATWSITVDTSGMEHCVASGAYPVNANCWASLSPMPGPIFRPTSCDYSVLTNIVFGEGCQYYPDLNPRYELSGFNSCSAVQLVNNSLIFDVSNGTSCNITSAMSHTGTLTVYHSYYQAAFWNSWQIQLLTGGLQPCADYWAGTGTLPTTVTTTPWWTG
ncbi:uncharacterized protein LOC129600643 [Paramacrobiotus metropolitanus]|uniref:uncharacterized protein LOC129600643 n=1 Tax=Paramacrobiotus metropolitanus TaxID=2943436 RepID=UPI0024460DA7|nr:uncharacterized protein LOC129600643 [Paramacrobiotus metropolitanus]